MQSTKQRPHTPIAALVVIGLGWALLGSAANAQTSHPGTAPLTLQTLFEQAWQRQPEAQSVALRREAARATRSAAAAWTAEPVALELSTKTDRPGSNQGSREAEVGLALPLWLPGERDSSQALADAEGEAVAGRHEALRLKLAQTLREAWWAWQSARNEVALAGERLVAARRLRDDVARRFTAGDLSRADLNQAQGVLALAEAQQAEGEAMLAGARYRLESLTGQPAGSGDVQPEPEPQAAAAAHPLLREVQARGEVARRNLDLARAQGRANPEIAVATRRERIASSEPTEQTWALALRIPFSAGPRQDARVATASAEAIEAGVEHEREAERLAREAEAVRRQVQAGRQQLAAAEQRARLARENRGFYEKSFRLGESDLPTRLRIESEAFEAERALGRARIALAQGISQLRQSLGLLPE